MSDTIMMLLQYFTAAIQWAGEFVIGLGAMLWPENAVAAAVAISFFGGIAGYHFVKSKVIKAAITIVAGALIFSVASGPHADVAQPLNLLGG